MLRVLQVGHVKVPGVVQDLKTYLKRTYSDVSVFEHPFASITELGKSTASVYEKYIHGVLHKQKHSYIPIGGELSFWVRDVVWTWWQAFRNNESYDVGIGMDCLNAATILVLKVFKKVRYVVYYTVDVTDKRFSNPLLSWVYMELDKRCCQFADEVWDVSIAVKSLRQKYGYDLFPKINRVVPIGIYPDEYQKSQRRRSRNPTIVYLGSLFSIMGVQLAVRAMPLILRRIPNAHFVIVGKGDYEHTLRTLVRELALEEKITFEYYHSRKDNIRRLFSATVGVAPYTYDEASYKFYCDPTKVKEYFAAGLPVVITDVPDVSKIIAELPMGVTVRYDTAEFADGVVSLLTDMSLYARCRKNIEKYIRKYSWNEIFNSAFVEINSRFV